ncbi:hypothetical protein TUBRATIS_008160 [Tubulinosema ratisbonensis]|uniref:Uncharacterized protein n=1 Tax=Tubulinosema ratisbonensis TaxID=291195 RepID=A0A437ANC7_9MICR|nr:hypothetical protein TUBRATIS_008160 [Tubulinosema ratisbonensis]
MDTGDLSKKRKEKTNTPKDLSIKGLINRIHELSKEVEKDLNCENKINASSPKCKTDDNDHKSLLDKLKNGNNDKSQQTTRTYINYQPGIGNSPSLKPDIYNQLRNKFGGHTPTSFNNPTTYIRKTSIPVLVCKNANQHDC